MVSNRKRWSTILPATPRTTATHRTCCIRSVKIHASNTNSRNHVVARWSVELTATQNTDRRTHVSDESAAAAPTMTDMIPAIVPKVTTRHLSVRRRSARVATVSPASTAIPTRNHRESASLGAVSVPRPTARSRTPFMRHPTPDDVEVVAGRRTHRSTISGAMNCAVPHSARAAASPNPSICRSWLCLAETRERRIASLWLYIYVFATAKTGSPSLCSQTKL